MALRRRYLITGITLACIVAGLIVTLLMTPQYTAATTLEIARESSKITNFQGVQRETAGDDREFYQTQYGLLKSRTLSERVARELGIVDDPNFFEMTGARMSNPEFARVNGRFVAQKRDLRQRAAGVILLRNLTVRPTRESSLVEIRFTSPSAQLSSQVINAWAQAFIQTNLERKVQATSYGRNLLQRELTQAKDRLDASQRQLVAYALEQRIINLPGQGSGEGASSERSIVADELAALNAALSQAIADRIQAEARQRQSGGAGASTEALRNQAINSLRQRRAEAAADYQRLLVQFEPQYGPALALKSQLDDLDRSIAREEKRVSSSIQSDYREALERETSLRARVEKLKIDYLDLRSRSIKYNIYQQEVDTSRALYDGLLQRFKEIGVAGGVGINNISIVDEAAIPEKPSSPILVLNLLIGLFAGLAISAALAVILEQLDDAIDDPADLQRQLGLPVLGVIPKVDELEPEATLHDRKSPLVEAYIGVQTSLSFATDRGLPRCLAVTSTRPSEGKSSTAIALATVLARTQRKVLLIDADMRSPSVHLMIGERHDVGLSNFLAGQDALDAMILPVPGLDIDAITAGPLPPNAAELLSGPRFTVLIERLLETYDHVIIDAPPVMGLADAPLIASKVEGILYVVESRSVRSGQIKTALARLIAVNAHIFGFVLTKFEAKRSSYGYGYGYGYGDGYGYGRGEPAKGASTLESA